MSAKFNKKHFSTFFKRKAATTDGEPVKNRGFLKKSTIGIIGLTVLAKLKQFITKDTEFEHKVRLIFP